MNQRPESRWSKPATLAGVLAGTYVLVAGAWIVLSSRFAALLSASVVDLHRLELVKGMLFVAVTGLGTFGLAFVLMSRLRRRHLEALAAREALLVSERRALAGLLAASIAHDCNNLACGLFAELDEISRSQLQPASREAMARVQSYLGRLTDLFKRLQTVGRAESREGVRDLDLARTVADTLELLRGQPQLRRVELTYTSGAALPMRATALLVDQLVMNLVLNAADATGGEGRVEVRVARNGDEALIEVHDDGPGVPADLRSKIFEPFFSTRGGEGRGLGLLAVRGCADLHGGSVEVVDSHLGGACFRIHLPLPAASASAA